MKKENQKKVLEEFATFLKEDVEKGMEVLKLIEEGKEDISSCIMMYALYVLTKQKNVEKFVAKIEKEEAEVLSFMLEEIKQGGVN